MQNRLQDVSFADPVTEEELVGVEWTNPQDHHRAASVMYLAVGKPPGRTITASAAAARFFASQGHERAALRFSADGRFVALVPDALGSLVRRTRSYQASYRIRHDLPSGTIIPLSMVQGGLLVGRLTESGGTDAPGTSVRSETRGEGRAVTAPAPPAPPQQPKAAIPDLCLVARLNNRRDLHRRTGSRLSLSPEAGRFFTNMGFHQVALRVSADGGYVAVMRDPGGVTVGNTRDHTSFSFPDDLVEETIPLSMIKGGLLVGRLTRKEP